MLISSILKVITDIKSNIIMVPIEQNIVEYAIHYIREYHLSADDGLHLCLADIIDCNYFITADKDYMREATQIRKLKIINVADRRKVDEFLKNLQ